MSRKFQFWGVTGTDNNWLDYTKNASTDSKTFSDKHKSDKNLNVWEYGNSTHYFRPPNNAIKKNKQSLRNQIIENGSCGRTSNISSITSMAKRMISVNTLDKIIEIIATNFPFFSQVNFYSLEAKNKSNPNKVEIIITMNCKHIKHLIDTGYDLSIRSYKIYINIGSPKLIYIFIMCHLVLVKNIVPYRIYFVWIMCW